MSKLSNRIINQSRYFLENDLHQEIFLWTIFFWKIVDASIDAKSTFGVMKEENQNIILSELYGSESNFSLFDWNFYTEHDLGRKSTWSWENCLKSTSEVKNRWFFTTSRNSKQHITSIMSPRPFYFYFLKRNGISERKFSSFNEKSTADMMAPFIKHHEAQIWLIESR